MFALEPVSHEKVQLQQEKSHGDNMTAVYDSRDMIDVA